jgi:hypothetical protein
MASLGWKGLNRHQYVYLILRQHKVWFINFPRYDQILQRSVDEDANIRIHSLPGGHECVSGTADNQLNLQNVLPMQHFVPIPISLIQNKN